MVILKIVRWWTGASLDGFHLFMAVVFGALWVIGWQLEVPGLEGAGYYGMAALILLHVIHWGLHSCRNFLELYKETDRLPDRQIKSVCRMFLGLLATVLAVFMLILPNINLDPLGNAVKGLLLALARLLGALFAGGREEVLSDGAEAALEFSAFPELGAQGEPSLWIRILEMLLQWAVSIALAGLAAWAVYRLWQKIRETLAKVSWDGDEKVFLPPEVLTGKAGRKKENSRKLSFSDRSYSARIRRLYRRTIKDGAQRQGSPLFPSASPAELEQAAGLPYIPGGLHDLYEKARYSREGAERQDWEKIRKQESLQGK